MPEEYGRQKILIKPNRDTKDTEDELVLNMSLRPQGFSEFIGQKDVVNNIKIAISAAKKRAEPLEHILFSGPPGLGKTSLSHLIAREMKTKITSTSGPAIERAGDLIGILTNLESGDVLFIDEIHRISKVVEEFLYPALEGYQIDFVIDKGPYAKTIKFNLKPFTLIGATTRSGLLSAALRSRFGLLYHLDFYGAEDLAKIIIYSSRKLDVSVEEQAALALARCSRGTPRIANRLLRRVRDYAQVSGIERVDASCVGKALDALHIDSAGLDDADRKILNVIIGTYDGGPVGVESLAASLNEEADTIVDCIEPYLLKAGYLKRTSRGRMVTQLAYNHLKISR